MAEKVTFTPKGKYIRTIGRRKRAVAQVRFYEAGGSGRIIVNERELEEYFPVATLRQSVVAPLATTGLLENHDITVKVAGGGIRGQADSIRLGIARALIEMNPDFRPALKVLGFLRRDARKKERKKPGLRSARRAPQWSKR